MDIFDVHRRDVYNFDKYMDLKKPGFGGNDSLIYDRDAKGKKTSNSNKLKDYRRVVKRDPMFKNPHYNSTYKAMTHDLVYKQEGEKPFTYRDPYLTGIATVEVGEYEHEETNESKLPKFNDFINEEKGLTGSIKKSVEIDVNVEKAMKEEKAKLEALKKEINNSVSEGKCFSFNQFSNISENWYDANMPYDTAEPETEEEVEIDIDTDQEDGPENPPRRGVNPNPKNMGGLEKAINDLMGYMDISRKEAEDILAIDVIKDLEAAEPETETEEDVQIDTDQEDGPENPPRRRVNPNPKNKYEELGEIIASYNEGPGAEATK